ncbi:hypothetical protein CDD83_8848 [Cordyceps sp. RAO-2017]|nr:hypothetical protein CDD83_8848 [Cordyceps sp. RAO-2017]
MSLSAAKRRARVISVPEEDESIDENPTSPSTNGDSKEESPKLLFGSRSGRKPFRQSGLRNSFKSGDKDARDGQDGAKEADDSDGPVVVRPSLSRPGSMRQKKKPPKSRLSFDTEPSDAQVPSQAGAAQRTTTLGQRAMGNSAAKRGVALRGLPTRLLQDDDDRPRYSKEYLQELQSSTPSTPRDVSTLQLDVDEMDLDASELEGALIVDSPAEPSTDTGTRIFTEAEIRERKERRARLAKEKDFLSVEDDDDDDDDQAGRKKKDDTRLLAEDEDLGEGFDDYVEDGGLSLGKRAQRERRKQERKQMAELISAAEGHSSDSSSDSDAERRIAYEAAQTRAGMDGLKKPRSRPADELLQIPPKITPLPSLTECLARLRTSLESMERDLNAKNARLLQLRRDKEEVEKREVEVQALLDETGKRYQEAMGQGKAEGLKPGAVDARNAELIGERGLESLGTTPARVGAEDVDMV